MKGSRKTDSMTADVTLDGLTLRDMVELFTLRGQALPAPLIDVLLQKHGADGPEYDLRNRLYTELLAHYIRSNAKKAVWNKIYKCIFFCVTMLLLLLLIGAPVLVIIIIVLKETPNLAIDLASLAGSLVSVISALLVLPKIIAQHLFPTDEDEHMIELVKNMQVNDSKIRDTLSGGERK